MTQSQDPRLKRATLPDSDHVRSGVTEYDICAENTDSYGFMIATECDWVGPCTGSGTGSGTGSKTGSKILPERADPGSDRKHCPVSALICFHTNTLL